MKNDEFSYWDYLPSKGAIITLIMFLLMIGLVVGAFFIGTLPQEEKKPQPSMPNDHMGLPKQPQFIDADLPLIIIGLVGVALVFILVLYICFKGEKQDGND